MKRYFVGNTEITEEQAKEIEKRNREIMESGDFVAMLEFAVMGQMYDVLNLSYFGRMKG